MDPDLQNLEHWFGFGIFQLSVLVWGIKFRTGKRPEMDPGGGGGVLFSEARSGSGPTWPCAEKEIVVYASWKFNYKLKFINNKKVIGTKMFSCNRWKRRFPGDTLKKLWLGSQESLRNPSPFVVHSFFLVCDLEENSFSYPANTSDKSPYSVNDR